MPLVNLGLTKIQTRSESCQNDIFHAFTSNLSYSKIFVKFDPMLTLGGTKNPNFDPTIRTGWDQCHCEDYLIPFPTNIVKTVEISRKPCKAHQHISQGHNFWSNYQIFNFFSVMETRHPELSRDTKISSIQVWEDLKTCIQSWTKKARIVDVNRGGWRPLYGRKPKGHNQAINASKPLILPHKKKRFWAVFWANPLSFLSNFSPKHI